MSVIITTSTTTVIEMRLLFLIGVVVWQAICSNAIIPPITMIHTKNTFPSDLFKTIAEDVAGNFVCSPVSASMVLSMATFGAGGHTEKILQETLYSPDDDALHLANYITLCLELNLELIPDIRMANKIYFAEDFKPKADFIDYVYNHFQSVPKDINFGNPAEATKTINDWAERKTRNQIKDIVKENDFTNATALVLVSAAYIEASWKNNFREIKTEQRLFYVNGKNAENLTTMWNLGAYRSDELPEVKAKFIEILYEGDFSLPSASMFIILPDEVDGIAELVRNLKYVTMQRLFNGTRRTINVYLPKFKIESTIDLEAPLKKLGLGEIFQDGASFTRIVDSPPLKVDKIVQKVFIRVTNMGTRTKFDDEMKMPQTSDDGTWRDFKVDHPFVAVIARDDGLVLFSSVIMKPIY